MEDKLRIGEISHKTGVSSDTIRYYEKRGLFKPSRSSTGYRYYDQDTLQRILFIKNTQKLGFSLREIKGLLDLRMNKSARAKDVKNITHKKLFQVQYKENNLRAIGRVLKRMIVSCDQEDLPAEQCPILKALVEFKLSDRERRNLMEGGLSRRP